jgi:hypothetical protein
MNPIIQVENLSKQYRLGQVGVSKIKVVLTKLKNTLRVSAKTDS